MTNIRRFRRVVTSTLVYAGITLGTLVAVDLVCVAFGIFPPTHDYGDPEVGWIAANPTGQMVRDRCTELPSGKVIEYTRNEDGVRTAAQAKELLTDTTSLKIAVTGDSQTDLCVPNAQTHFGVLESELRKSGAETTVFAFGAGRYSPLQAYLAFKKSLRQYAPDAFVLNLYTGNDFYDLLRIDDRPHFKRTDGEYKVVAPVWYLLDDPTVQRRSRMLFLLRTLAKKTGLRNTYLRVQFLRRAAAEQGQGIGAVLGYINDLRKSVAPSVGYGSAFAAQMLNQQLFFHRFPGSREESIRRVRALMELARRENPDLLLVMSPLPSYELVHRVPVDTALLQTLERLPITYEGGIQEEEALYSTLGQLAAETGWLFVDNLAPLREYEGSDRLYNDFDYHLLPVASAIVGQTEAAAIGAYLQSQNAALRRDRKSP